MTRVLTFDRDRWVHRVLHRDPRGAGRRKTEARAYAYLRQLRADFGKVSPDPKVDAYIATLLHTVQRLTTPEP